MLALAGVTGCSAAPSQNILGSYFPSWMICALAGVGATVVARVLLVALGIDRTLPIPLVVYLSLTIAFAFAVWLLWLD
ncbi:MAG: YtcA family lipoprotein [Azospirillaceae bacterium]|nr:YtcA family lipoprotein [Azospirillaceae bacterium]